MTRSLCCMAMLLLLGMVGCSDRARLDRLQARVAVLERDAAVQSENQAMLVRALDRTADQLDLFLRRVSELQGVELDAAPADTLAAADTEPAPPQPGAGKPTQAAVPQSARWWSWWPLPAALLALALLVTWLASRDRAPRAAAVQATEDVAEEEEEPLIVLEPDDFDGDDGMNLDIQTVLDPPPAEPPVELEQEVQHDRPAVLRDVMREWLSADPRVLLLPEPRFETGAGILRVRYHLVPDLAPTEIASLQADLAGLGGGAGPSTTTADSHPDGLFLHGKAPAQSYTPRPRAAENG